MIRFQGALLALLLTAGLTGCSKQASKSTPVETSPAAAPVAGPAVETPPAAIPAVQTASEPALLSAPAEANPWTVSEQAPSFLAKDRIENTPAFLSDGRTLVFGALDANVYFLKFNADFTQYESKFFRTQAPMLGSPRELSTGEVVIAAADGRVFWLDRDANMTHVVGLGTDQIWTTPAELMDRTLVLGDRAGKITFFNKNGIVKRFQAPATSIHTPEFTASPTTYSHGQRVTIGCENGIQYSFDVLGNRNWGFVTGSLIVGSATEILVGPWAGSLAFGSNDDFVYLINPYTGQWRRSQVEQAISTPTLALRDGSIAFGTMRGRVWVYRTNGTRQFYQIPGEPFLWGAQAELPDGTIVVGSTDGSVYFLDPLTVTLRAKFTPPPPTGPDPRQPGIWSGVTVLPGGIAAVGSHDGHMYFLKLVRNTTPQDTWSEFTPNLQAEQGDLESVEPVQPAPAPPKSEKRWY